MRELRDEILLKEVGRLRAGLPDNEDWVDFLGKRRRRVGSTLFTQPKSKFVDGAAPKTLELYHRDYKMAQLAMRGPACEVEAPTHATMDRLRHLVRYFFGAKLYQNMMTPGDKRLICVWSDSDWAGDRQSRRNVDSS